MDITEDKQPRAPGAVRVSTKISPLLLLNHSVYWKILLGVYISSADLLPGRGRKGSA
jgi:hypothetical protein